MAPEVNRLVTARGWGVEEPLACAGAAFCPALHTRSWSSIGPRKGPGFCLLACSPSGSHPIPALPCSYSPDPTLVLPSKVQPLSLSPQ